MKIYSELISISKQIEIIDEAIFKLNNNLHEIKSGEVGLCNLLGNILNIKDVRYSSHCYRISEFIPLFTRDNALEYANGTGHLYWWKVSEKGYDYKNRLLFLNWIRTQLINTSNNEL